MSYADFLRAITPFNNVTKEDEIADEYIKTNKKSVVFDIIDSNNDKTISFTEFSFFLTLTQMPDN